MKYLEELLFLQSLPKVGKATIYQKYIQLLQMSNDINNLIDMLAVDPSTASAIKGKIAYQMEALTTRTDISVITVLDEEYPASLYDLGNKKPLALFIRGNGSLLSKPGIAVIGTRSPSLHTKKIEPGLVKNIIEFTGDPIISGLATGCDAIAHEASILYKGKTIAVLPGGIDKIYPPAHTDLARRIVSSGGCLVSEYGLDSSTFKYSFIERDSVIAALSHTIIAVECSKKSGTMATVKAGTDMRRKIGCYIPKDMTLGDFSGNEYMEKELSAVGIKDTLSLQRSLTAPNYSLVT